MGRAKSAAEVLRLGYKKSSKKESNIVNEEIIFKTLEPVIKRNYDKIIEK